MDARGTCTCIVLRNKNAVVELSIWGLFPLVGWLVGWLVGLVSVLLKGGEVSVEDDRRRQFTVGKAGGDGGEGLGGGCRWIFGSCWRNN